MKFAPIALFVYNRPVHLRRTIEALQNNEHATESDLIIYSDAPETADVLPMVLSVREYISKINGFRSIKIVSRDLNYGLAESIISGVTEILGKYDRVIVLEDDMVTSKYFLRYMNEALELYENKQEVIGINAYTFPVSHSLPETFLLRGINCWGWATWRRGWSLFEPSGKKLMTELRKRGLENEFDFNNAYPYTKMLQDQIDGVNNSWAVRWYASAFVLGKLSLYPGRSLVNNIGMDSTGTHCCKTNKYDSPMVQAPVTLELLALVENSSARKEYSSYFITSVSTVRRILRKLKGLLVKRPEIR